MVAFPAETPVRAREMLDMLLPMAQKIFLERGDHRPLLFTYRRGRAELGIFDVAVLMDEKDELEALMVSLARRGADALALVSECWTLEVDAGDQAASKAANEYVRTHSLADHPQRVEILMVLVQTPSHEIQAHARIERSGSKPTLGEWNYMCESMDAAHRKKLGLPQPRFQEIFHKAREQKKRQRKR